MIQLFAIGEVAVLQSLDAPIELWNAKVIVERCTWMDNPIDVHGMPQPSTFAYIVDASDRIFAQSALRKLDVLNIVIKEKMAETV